MEETAHALRNRISERDASVLAQLVEWSSGHGEWRVRLLCLELLAEHFIGEAAAVRAIGRGTHDPVDWVAFTAIRLAGRHSLRPLVPDLIKISGWPSNFTREDFLRKPVGLGAAFTKHALLKILGATEPGELRRLEDELFAPWRTRVEGRRRGDGPADVVIVPAGPFAAGSTSRGDNPFRLDDTDNPLGEIDLPAFRIDRTAVTNARYSAFLEDAEGTDEFDHPDQAPGKGHVPAYWDDPRFNDPALPVVGIDWYDAWAFARWAGGALPSEHEWEKAARGGDGRTYPWGEGVNPDVCNYVERSFGRKVADLREWERLLLSVTLDDLPDDALLPADDLPAGASPYGVLQMSGNVWEMTRTNFFTRGDMDPFFKGREPAEFVNRKDAFHVLRGGAWTSPPPCLTTHYRGRDLITDRHSEVGFRCVYHLADR